jgi:hypothetical protein
MTGKAPLPTSEATEISRDIDLNWSGQYWVALTSRNIMNEYVSVCLARCQGTVLIIYFWMETRKNEETTVGIRNRNVTQLNGHGH